MLEKVFDIEKFNIISDDDNYYFFRALNMADNRDIENGITLDASGSIKRIRTDRERYDGTPKYNMDSKISLEEVFNHIKIHHRTDTNCISLTSNANAAILYGRGYYKDKYLMIKVPKKEFGEKVSTAGLYMMNEINKRIDEYISAAELTEMQKYYLDYINYAENQEALDRILEIRKKDNTEADMFERGITLSHTDTVSVDYQALDSEQNFQKNKLIAKLNIIQKNMLPGVRNVFLIRTLGNAFSSLELIHYKDIEQNEIVEIPTELVDVFALLQQLPKDNILVEELKLKMIDYVNKNPNSLEKFKFDDYKLNSDEEYTIEKMYYLTNGRVNFFDSINLYKKSFYLAKSKLRAENLSNILKTVTNDNYKYKDIINYLKNNTYGVEPDIFSRITSNRINVSESVSLDFAPREKEHFEYINGLSNDELVYILDNPTENLKSLLDRFPSLDYRNVDQETYYANAIIDLFDWSKIDVVSFSNRQRNQIVNSLKNSRVVDVYNILKERGVKEKDIANALLTIVIKNKELDRIDLRDTFTLEELEDFLGYYKINNTKGLQLKSYQAKTVENIDELFKDKQFAAAVLPTGAGKTFVALSEMLEHSSKEILYLAPNDIILDQVRNYILNFICDEDLKKTDEQKIKERFPKLKLCTYQSLVSDNKNGIINDLDRTQNTTNKKYKLIVFDELHRTGAKEWEKSIFKLLDHQDKDTKVLGITATPLRDMDDRNMADEWAKYYGYSEESIIEEEHLAMNMDLLEAIRLGYVVEPKVVNCEYSMLNKNGFLDKMLETINLVPEEERALKLAKFDALRRRVEQADGVGKVLNDNIKQGGKYIVFCPVINKDGKVLEDEDGNEEDYRVDPDEVIKKYKAELISHLGENFDLEFYSVLGKYGKARNLRQLEEFEKDDSNKVKLMLCINLLNEGRHSPHVDGCIWYRPLDENSNILYHQHLGRIIYAIDPNKPLPDEQRPTVIDLVNNTLRINMNKDKRPQESDLSKLKAAIGWIEQHDLKMPDINSSDRIESSYAVTLEHIQKKYSDYIDDKQLYDNLNETRRKEISEIIKMGDNIDLWNTIFPERIRKEKIRTTSDDLSLFQLTGIMRDYTELMNSVNESIYMTSQEKKEEYIKTVHELHGHPSSKERNNGAPAKFFRDGTNQRGYYNHLRETYQKLDPNKKLSDLSDREKQIKTDYEEIEQAVNQYTMTSQEKKEEYIKTVNELHGHPSGKESKTGAPVRFFRDGTNQRTYYNVLKGKYQKLDPNKKLSDREKQIKTDYEEIEQAVNQYTMTSQEKKEEYIKTIHELHGHPSSEESKTGAPVRFFRDGTNQRTYYNRLKGAYQKLDPNKKLSDLSDREKQIKTDYEEIEQAVNQYTKEIMAMQEKKEEYIKTLHELHGHPSSTEDNKNSKPRFFRDGTNQRGYYNSLQRAYQKLDPNKKLSDLSDREKQIKTDYEEIEQVVNQYTMTPQEKKEEYIKTVHELHGHPSSKESNKGGPAKIFRDGTNQRTYYDRLKSAYQKLDPNVELTEEETKIKNDYEEIEQVVNQYTKEIMGMQEKKEEYIKTIHELHGHPSRKESKNGAPVRFFRDGTNQRNYYNSLQEAYEKLDPNKKLSDLSDREKQIKTDYEEIEQVVNQYTKEIMGMQEKKEEYIKTIHELHGHPASYESKTGAPVKFFRDGTNQRNYYNKLQRAYQKLDPNKKLSDLSDREKEIKSDYEEIEQVVNQYTKEIMGMHEKKEEYIKTIQELHGHPASDERNNGAPVRFFRDGTNQKNYYNRLKKIYQKLDPNKKLSDLSDREKQIKTDYEEINEVMQKIKKRDKMKETFIETREKLEEIKNSNVGNNDVKKI